MRALGQPEHIAELLGLTAAIHESISSPLAPLARAEVERDVMLVRATLGDAAYTAA